MESLASYTRAEPWALECLQPPAIHFYPDTISEMTPLPPQPAFTSFSAFDGTRLLASGPPETVKAVLRRHAQGGHSSNAGPVLVFDDQSGRQVELDLRTETPAPDPEVSPASRKPGRPRLGVVAREVTLLPRHWDWLNLQPGGASVALRRLVEHARRQSPDAQDARGAREATYAFMSAMAGNLSHFEEASRALFAGDSLAFHTQTAEWPADVRGYLHRLSRHAFEPGPSSEQQESAP